MAELACTAVWPNFGPSTKVAIRRFRNYDNTQVRLLDPYWDEPACWADEVISRTLYHFAKTPSLPGQLFTDVTTTTRTVTGPNGPLTFVERTTLGSDVATVTINSSRIIPTTRTRGDANHVPGILATLTNSLGQPISTSTSFPFGFTQRLTPITLRDPSGCPSATTWTPESLSTCLLTLTDPDGSLTLTLTEYARACV